MRTNFTFIYTVLLWLGVAQASWGQVSLTTSGTAYTQNFTSFTAANAGSLPTGWSASFTGTANYAGYGTGASTTGGVWSYGTDGTGTSTERALGALRTGTSGNIAFTASFTNNIGVTITALDISYNCEQWRYANTSGLAVTQTNIGTAVSGLDHSGVASGTNGTVTSTAKSINLTGLSIANGTTFTLVWTTTDITGADNGIAIDNFSLTPTAPSGSFTSTLASSATLSEPATISSLNTAFTGASAPQQNAVANFDFNIVNSDASAIQFSQLVFNTGTGNGVTSWTNALQEARLSDGTNTVTSTTITANSITFASLPNGAGNIGNAPVGTKTYTFTVRFKTTLGGSAPTTIDGQDFVFLVNNSSFTFAAGGLASTQAVNSGDGNNTVAVVASQLAFITQPSNAVELATMTSPTVQATDANGNRDLGYVTSVSVTSTGTLDATPKTATPTSGLATFSNIVHTTAGTGLTLTASSGGLTSALSNTFDITQLTNSESDVVAVASSEAVTISSIENTATISTATQGVQVWQLTIRDGGSDITDADGLPTIVNSLVLSQGTGNNILVWTNIQSVAIFNGATFLANGTIASNTLTFTGAPLISVPDNGQVTLSVRLSLKTTLTIPASADGSDFVFRLTSANFTTASSATSSQKLAFTTINSTDGQNAISVLATELRFSTQPSNSTVGASMTSPVVQATDANGNRDLDYVTTVSVTSTGVLDVTPKTATPASGVATFSNVVHTVSGTGLTLTASSGSLTSALSNTFNISVVINGETFGVCGSLTWTPYDVAGDNVWTCGSGYAEMNGFGGTTDQDWLISPALNLSLYANEVLTFRNAKDFTGPDLQLVYSTDYDGVSNPSTNGTWTTLTFTKATNTTFVSSGSVSLSSIVGTSVYLAFKYTATGTGSGQAALWRVDDISITGALTGATLIASPTSRTGFTYAQGAGPSTSQSFNLSAANLTPSADNITLVPPTNYEISTDNASFTSSNILIAYTGGTLASTPIYIRLKAGLTAGNYNGELINISGGGASAIDVTCSGSVYLLPQVALSSPNPAIASYNITRGTTNNVIYRFDLAVTDADATLTNISFTTGGSYTAGNLNNIKIWYSPDATFTASGNDVQLRSKTTNLKTNPQTFTAFSQTITAGDTGYFFLTTDVVCGAGEGNTISVNALTTSDLTVTLGNKTGTAFASGTHTFVASAPNDITSPITSSCQNGGTTVGWTLPTGCYDNVLVFATSGSFTIALPTGNGGAYTANTAFGSGTAFDGGFCVYKGTGTSVNVTGLSNGTNYTYKIFVRSSTFWSNGVSTSCTPTTAYCTSNGDGTDSFNTGVRLVTFNTINNATGDIDNAYSDFTGISTSVAQSTAYNLTVNVNTGGNYTVYTKVWIDWNQDGDFGDAGEEYNMGTAVNVSDGITTFSPTSITVPAGATVGTTRMRVSARYNTAPIPCEMGFDGEVEDYTLVVTAPCSPTHTITSFLPTSGSTGTMVLITGTGFSASSMVIFGTVSATSVTFISSTQIVAEVPAGFTSANIKVIEASCEQISGSTFSRTESSGTCYAPVSGLIISELYDGFAGSLGYIEIYNGTNATIDLSTYSIDRFNDNAGGATHTYTFPASGVGSSIASGQVLVGKVSNDANTAGITPHFTFTGSVAGYNELDRLELKNGATKIDEVIAQGVDVGYSYFRKVTVTAPNPTFDANEWTFVTTENTTDISVFAPNLAVNITANPADVTACSFNMSVTATSSSALTYQWYFNDRTAMTGWQTVTTGNLTTANASNSGVTVSGETSNSLTLTGLLTNLYNYQFYCEVSSGGCVKLSNAAQFTYNSFPVYRSVAGSTGAWTTVANWEMANTTAGPWSSACTYPTSSNSSEVIIQNGTNIALGIDLVVDKVTIENNATFEVAPNAELDITNQNAGADLIVNGTFYYRSNSSNTMGFATGATWSIATDGILIKTNTSSAVDLKNNYEGGISTIPATANFIFRYNGDGNVSVTSIDMFYPNLTFESTSGFWDGFTTASSFVGSTGGFATVKGNLDIGGTGTGTVKIYIENYNVQPMLVLGNLTIRAGNTFTNDGITDLGVSDNKGRGLEIRGNLVVDGTLTMNATDVNVTSPIVKFSGTAGEQTISGAGTLNLYELEVNKTAILDLKLLRSIAVGNLLDIQLGDLNLNGFNVDMGTAGTLNENVASNYLVKDLTATTEANKGGYIRFSGRNINNSQTSIGGSRLWLNWTSGADYTVNFDRYHYRASYGKAIPLIYAVAVNSGTMGTTNLRISYADAEVGILMEPLNVARWSISTGWAGYIPDVSSDASNFSQRNSITQFSHWTLSDFNVLLDAPVALSAQQIGKQASRLEWANAQGESLVLQKSTDGIHFENLAYPDANYFIDNAFTQNAYYRLQVTKAGNAQNSNIAYLQHRSQDGIAISPNPYKQGQIKLYLGSYTCRQVDFIDVQGRVVGKITDVKDLERAVEKLTAGTYILRVLTTEGVQYLRFVKL